MKDEIISAEKLYKILHYSKRKTKYLLDNGVIPCKNSGKKTRCYQVKMSDVTIYLEKRNRDGDQYFYPAGLFSSNYSNQQPWKIDMSEDGYRRLYGIIKRGLSKALDALTVDNAAAVTGYSRTLILRSVQSGALYAEKIFANYIIPKEKLISFLAGKHGLAIKYKSNFHKKMLRIFIKQGEQK